MTAGRADIRLMDDRTTSFQDLRAWQSGMVLVQHTYAFCATLPPTERFGLNDQLRRAAVSVPANIAEGYGRTHVRDYMRFLSIGLGSLREVETLLLIARQLELGDPALLTAALNSCAAAGRMLVALHQGLKRKIERTP